jgi:hypothetical protein
MNKIKALAIGTSFVILLMATSSAHALFSKTLKNLKTSVTQALTQAKNDIKADIGATHAAIINKLNQASTYLQSKITTGQETLQSSITSGINTSATAMTGFLGKTSIPPQTTLSTPQPTTTTTTSTTTNPAH